MGNVEVVEEDEVVVVMVVEVVVVDGIGATLEEVELCTGLLLVVELEGLEVKVVVVVVCPILDVRIELIMAVKDRDPEAVVCP